MKLIHKLVGSVKRKIVLQILLPLLLTILLFVFAIGYLLAGKLEDDLLVSAEDKAATGTLNLTQSLTTINSLMIHQVETAINIFKSECLNYGEPKIDGTAPLQDITVPKLMFGKENMVMNYKSVDVIKSLAGCTATIFVKDGSDFVRISTNVIKDGVRAIKTKLDPNGKAIKSVAAGEPFYGVVDILGVPYITGYEPIKINDQVIGVWYCGFPISALEQLGKQIASLRILENGFFALVDNKGNISFHSNNVDAKKIKTVLDDFDKGDTTEWKVKESKFDPWNYKLIAATFSEDVDSQIRRVNIMALLISTLFTLVIAFTIYFIFKRKIGDKLKKLKTLADGIALGKVDLQIMKDSEDEIGDLEQSFSSMIENIKEHAEVADKISEGNLDVEINAKSEDDLLSISLQKVAGTIRSLISESVKLSSAAVEGNLTARANDSMFRGGYREVVKGMNSTLDAIIKPINESGKVLEVLSQGNLTVRMEGDYKGDYSKIKHSINSLADSFNDALSEITSAVHAAASAGNQISSSTEEMAAGAQEQSTQTAEVAGAVEEMSRTIIETTKFANDASGAAKNAGKIAHDGGKVVGETIEGMNRVAEVVRKSAATVEELGKSSNEIGEIIQVIDDIADQTNLLALNAAIEAARAGEQGRGFAVVADEVRKLAERTTKATQEIASMIKHIQKDTLEAVESIKSGTVEVEKGKELADKAGQSLKKIIVGSEEVVGIVTQVAAASSQQSAAAEEISKNIDGINNVTQETAQGIQQIAHASEDLSNLTVELQNLISRFIIEVHDGHRITQGHSSLPVKR